MRSEFLWRTRFVRFITRTGLILATATLTAPSVRMYLYAVEITFILSYRRKSARRTDKTGPNQDCDSGCKMGQGDLTESIEQDVVFRSAVI